MGVRFVWRQKALGLFSSFRSADQDWIDSSSRSPLTPALFLNGSELLAPLCTRRDVPADNLGPTCRYCPQAFQRCSESLLHLSLCCQSASEASLSLQFLRAPVTPPREEKKDTSCCCSSRGSLSRVQITGTPRV